MMLAKAVTKTMMCVSVLAVGCVNQAYSEDEEALSVEGEEHEESKYWHLPIALPEGGGGGGGGDGQDPTVVGVETLDVTIPASLHAQELAVPAKLVRPKWSKPAGKRPAMMVLHGSGGLLKMPKNQGDDPCSSEMESQFVTWSERLAELGYTVLLPSSYSARGFCDKHVDTDRMPSTFDDNTEQILGRTYDVDAAARYLCDRPEVDCDRMGLLGFSQGATMVMVALHWQIEHALAYFRDTKGGTVDIEIPDVAPDRPEFQIGIAYYPGCGFDGVVPLSTGANAAVDNKFLATAPLFVLHASDDSLVGHCSTKHGTGGREIQSGQVASQLKVADTYELTVYPDAGHSFDSAGSKAEGGTPEGNLAARDAALAVALEQLDLHLQK